MLQTCHMAQPEGDACAVVSSRGAGCRVVRGFSGRSRVTGRLGLKEKCRWAGLCVSALDSACGSRVVADGLGRNWAYGFGLRRLGRGSRRVLG